MKTTRLFNKVAATLLATSVFLSGAVISNAADYTEDGTAEIPVSASIQGGYKLSLPAVLNSISTIEDDATGNAYVDVPITVDWNRMAGKGLYLSERGSTITNGSTTYKIGFNFDFLCGYGTDFKSSMVTEYEVGGKTAVMSNSSSNKITTDSNHQTNTGVISPSSVYTCPSQIAIRDNSNNQVKLEDMPAGTYTGELEVSWTQLDINSTLLN